VSSLERLQNWYLRQCNGDWEHVCGVRIETLDNPGWSVEIDLKETPLARREFESLCSEKTEDDWLFLSRSEEVFKIACGPGNLEDALAIFCTWAECETDPDALERVFEAKKRLTT
jgi:hypothetical protein